MCVCIVFGMFMYVLMVYPVISQAHFGHTQYKNYLDGSQNRKTQGNYSRYTAMFIIFMHGTKYLLLEPLGPTPQLTLLEDLFYVL